MSRGGGGGRLRGLHAHLALNEVSPLISFSYSRVTARARPNSISLCFSMKKSLRFGLRCPAQETGPRRQFARENRIKIEFQAIFQAKKLKPFFPLLNRYHGPFFLLPYFRPNEARDERIPEMEAAEREGKRPRLTGMRGEGTRGARGVSGGADVTCHFCV